MNKKDSDKRWGIIKYDGTIADEAPDASSQSAQIFFHLHFKLTVKVLCKLKCTSCFGSLFPCYGFFIMGYLLEYTKPTMPFS
jgi:hypothetical protein